MNELSEQLTDILKAGVFTEDAEKGLKKAVDNIINDIESDVMYRLKDDLAPNLSAWVEEMAQRTVEQLLEGNESQMLRYLHCDKGQWTGRSTEDIAYGRKRLPHEWHSVIHGRLFEQGSLLLRKKIVDAHAELLKNQRILDLEDQVNGLVAQVNKANAEKEAMWERVRSLS